MKHELRAKDLDPVLLERRALAPDDMIIVGPNDLAVVLEDGRVVDEVTQTRVGAAPARASRFLSGTHEVATEIVLISAVPFEAAVPVEASTAEHATVTGAMNLQLQVSPRQAAKFNQLVPSAGTVLRVSDLRERIATHVKEFIIKPEANVVAVEEFSASRELQARFDHAAREYLGPVLDTFGIALHHTVTSWQKSDNQLLLELDYMLDLAQKRKTLEARLGPGGSEDDKRRLEADKRRLEESWDKKMHEIKHRVAAERQSLELRSALELDTITEESRNEMARLLKRIEKGQVVASEEMRAARARVDHDLGIQATQAEAARERGLRAAEAAVEAARLDRLRRDENAQADRDELSGLLDVKRKQDAVAGDRDLARDELRAREHGRELESRRVDSELRSTEERVKTEGVQETMRDVASRIAEASGGGGFNEHQARALEAIAKGATDQTALARGDEAAEIAKHKYGADAAKNSLERHREATAEERAATSERTDDARHVLDGVAKIAEGSNPKRDTIVNVNQSHACAVCGRVAQAGAAFCGTCGNKLQRG